MSEEEDLWQYKDRDQWYLARWAAVDQPEWNAARFVRSSQLAPGVKELVLEVEVSRERVPIRAAYKHVGQAAQVRVGGGAAVVVPPSSPPFPVDLLKDALLRVRGDMTAGEIKKAVEDGSVLSELSLLVRQADSPELFAAGGDDAFEVGPFVGTGLALRGPVAAIFQRPTLVIFCEGDGVAAARALALATPQVGGLSFKMRQDVRMYYRVSLGPFSATLRPSRRLRPRVRLAVRPAWEPSQAREAQRQRLPPDRAPAPAALPPPLPPPAGPQRRLALLRRRDGKVGRGAGRQGGHLHPGLVRRHV